MLITCLHCRGVIAGGKRLAESLDRVHALIVCPRCGSGYEVVIEELRGPVKEVEVNKNH